MVQAIGKLGGVSYASRELNVSQPAVSQAVANLETEIGSPLFVRCATGTYPTQVGEQYLLRIDRFFSILDQAVTQAMGRLEGWPNGLSLKVERLITGTQLRSFMIACEKGRVNEISRSIGLTPNSLFRSARTLERALGKPLFDRTAQGPIPNKTGIFLDSEFRRACREIALARGEIFLASGKESLELVVGALPMAGSFDLVEATRQFMASYPAVKVRLVSGEHHKLLADLASSRIDLIFGMLRKTDCYFDVNEEILFSDNYCMVTHPGHPLVQLDEVTPADLAKYDWVVPSLGTPRRNRIEAIFKGQQYPSFHLETSSPTLIRAFLLSSNTITLMTRSEVQFDLDLGNLVSLPCPFLKNVLLKGVTTRSDWLPTNAHSAFINCLREITADARHGPHKC